MHAFVAHPVTQHAGEDEQVGSEQAEPHGRAWPEQHHAQAEHCGTHAARAGDDDQALVPIRAAAHPKRRHIEAGEQHQGREHRRARGRPERIAGLQSIVHAHANDQ